MPTRGDRPAHERLALLDDLGRRLRLAAGEAPRDPPDSAGDPPGVHPDTGDILLALRETLCALELPVELLEDLLSAYRQDVTVRRYATWEDVLDYCRRSANPVGRSVLRIFGYRDERFDHWSDAVCSALQIANFLQDLAGDWRQRGRLYVPAEIYAGCGARLSDLDRGRITPEWREAIGICASRTRALFQDGRPVCAAVAGRLRLELRFTWLGGMRILDYVERPGYDPFGKRPRLGVADALPLLWRALVWA